MIFNQTMRRLQQELMAKYVVSSTIRHKGEKGRQREHGLALFLREHLPLAYGVATGEIVSTHWNAVKPHSDDVSPQCDIILFDQLNYPILGKSDPVQQVPIDAVYAVIEVKSALDKKELADAKRKFEQVSRMHETFRKARKIRERDASNPTFVAFGYHSTISHKLLGPQIGNGFDDYMVVALDKGIGIHLDHPGGPRGVWLDTENAAKGQYQSLAWFFCLLLESMRNVNLGKPSYGYLT